jgi:hypothetical protein
MILALCLARVHHLMDPSEAAMLQLRRSFELAFAVVLAGAALAPCDEVWLRGGGRVSGVIVDRTPQTVVIETGPGRVSLPMSRVEKIVDGRSSLATFQERAAALTPSDADGWATLARWASDHDLVTPSRSAWQRVLALDPQNPDANAALGRVSFEGAWMPAEDAYRARGYVQYEGRWVTPAEHAAALRERAADDASELQARESNARVREAEARASEAQARARDAEYADTEGGIPLYPYVYGGGGYGFGYGGYRPGYGNGMRPSHPIVRPHSMVQGRPLPVRSQMHPAPQPAPSRRPMATSSMPAPHHTAALATPPSTGR